MIEAGSHEARKECNPGSWFPGFLLNHVSSGLGLRIQPADKMRMRTFRPTLRAFALVLALQAAADLSRAADKPFLTSELIFPLEYWHNHGSCIVEAPNGDLIVCWFHGSGERTADDVKVEGARLGKKFRG
jgi:hypothetical protein